MGTRAGLVRHVVVAMLVAAFVGMGFWQLSRLGERRAFNATLAARSSQPVTGVGDLIASATPADVAYRRARAIGLYDVANEVVLYSRSHDGLSGHHVLTPLRVGGDAALLVDRGWVPIDFDSPGDERAAPPNGIVTVEGLLAPSQVRGRFGPREVEQGPYEGVFRVDLDLLAEQMPYELLPLFLQLDEQTPPQATGRPIPVPLPRLDEGPHLSYAIQWFLFAAGLVVGDAALTTRRRARHDASRAP
ncbi:MAG TPA: SURF1 family protein [Actinomycetota bacterium]